MIRKITIVFLALFTPLVMCAQEKADMLQKGEQLFASGDYKKAVDHFEKIAKKYPADEEGYLGLGKCYYELDNFKDCYPNLLKAIEINSKSAYAYYYRGAVMLRSNKAEDATNDFNMAIKYNTNDTLLTHCYLMRSSCKLDTRDFSGSISDAKVVLARDSANYKAMCTMSLSMSEAGQKEEALMWMKKAVELDTTSMLLIQNIGFILSGLERYDEALPYFDRAIRNDPKQAYPYSNRGYIKMKMKDYNGALDDINKSIKLDESNSYAFRNRALVYLELKDPIRACKDLSTAHRLGFDKQYGEEVNQLIEKNCR